MSPLMKALEKSDVVDLETNKRSVLIITCPDMCQYPKLLTNSDVNVFYSQNIYNLLIGILDDNALKSLWDNIQASIALYQITDVVFLAHYPCGFLEKIHQCNHDTNLSPSMASVFSEIKSYITSHNRTSDSLSQKIICQLSNTNRKAFEEHPAIKLLIEKKLLNVHSWIFDHEEQQTYLFSLDKDNIVKRLEI